MSLFLLYTPAPVAGSVGLVDRERTLRACVAGVLEARVASKTPVASIPHKNLDSVAAHSTLSPDAFYATFGCVLCSV